MSHSKCRATQRPGVSSFPHFGGEAEQDYVGIKVEEKKVRWYLLTKSLVEAEIKGDPP